MIGTVAGAITGVLEDLNVLRAVEREVGMKILQRPPSAAVILAADGELLDNPVARLLDFDIVLAVSATGSDKGHDAADAIIDMVRERFVGAVLIETGGTMPASVPFIRLEGMEKNLLIYTVRVRVQVVPAVIDKEE